LALRKPTFACFAQLARTVLQVARQRLSALAAATGTAAGSMESNTPNDTTLVRNMEPPHQTCRRVSSTARRRVAGASRTHLATLLRSK